MRIRFEQNGNFNTIQTGTTQANSAADLRITSIGTSGSTYMTIATSGNVGIGTTSPQSTLHVKGDIAIDGLITVNAGAEITFASYQQNRLDNIPPVSDPNSNFNFILDQSESSLIQYLEYNGINQKKIKVTFSGIDMNTMFGEPPQGQVVVTLYNSSNTVLQTFTLSDSTPSGPQTSYSTTFVVSLQPGDKFGFSNTGNGNYVLDQFNFVYDAAPDLSVRTISATTFTGANVSVSNITTGSIRTTNQISTNITTNSLIASTLNVPNIEATGAAGPLVIDPNFSSDSFVRIWDRLQVAGSLDITTGSFSATHNSNTVGSIFTTGGNVGIATTAPGTGLPLHVNGRVQVGGNSAKTTTSLINGRALFVTGNGSNVEISLEPNVTSGNRSYIYCDNNQMQLASPGYINIGNPFQATSNSNTVGSIFTTGGNVGIGTTSPNERLSLVTSGNIRLTASGWENGCIRFSSTLSGASSSTNYFIQRGGQDNYKDHLVLHSTNSTNAGINFVSDGGVSRFLVNCNTGNIGINNSSPTNRLDIANNARSGTHPTGRPLYVTGDIGAQDTGIEFRHSNSSQGIGFGYNGIYACGSNQSISILPTGSGNVGIGTGSPGYKLDVSATSRISGDIRMNGNLYLNETSNGSNNPIIYFVNNGHYIQNFNNNGHKMLYQSGGHYLMGGNVGIDTSSPGKRLDIQGDFGRVRTPGGGMHDPSLVDILRIGRWDGSANDDHFSGIGCSVISGNHSLVRFYTWGNAIAMSREVAHIDNYGRMYNSSGTYGTLSDINLKENIETARDYLNDILQLRVVKYSLKSENQTQADKLGFIAQEIETVFPNLVDTHKYTIKNEDGQDEEQDVKMIKTSVLLPMSIKSIQELNQKLESEKQAHSITKSRLDALETFIQNKFPGEF